MLGPGSFRVFLRGRLRFGGGQTKAGPRYTARVFVDGIDRQRAGELRNALRLRDVRLEMMKSRHAVPVLQSLLGHASPETTMIYTHPLEDVNRQAVEDLASLLFPNVPSKQKLISKGIELIQ